MGPMECILYYYLTTHVLRGAAGHTNKTVKSVLSCAARTRLPGVHIILLLHNRYVCSRHVKVNGFSRYDAGITICTTSSSVVIGQGGGRRGEVEDLGT